MSEAAGLSAKHERQCSGSHNEPDCISTELHLIIPSRGERERWEVGEGVGGYQESWCVTDRKILTKKDEG